MRLIMRKTDRKLFRASFPDGYDEEQAWADTIIQQEHWYFRAIQRKPWWQKPLFQKYRDTGGIWQPSNGWEFFILPDHRE